MHFAIKRPTNTVWRLQSNEFELSLQLKGEKRPIEGSIVYWLKPTYPFPPLHVCKLFVERVSRYPRISAVF